jgi:hypothetical protein
MKVFRLRHKQYKGDIIFGMPPTYCKKIGEKKIHSMLLELKPWKYAIPYYNKSKFAFISSDALLTFLFGNFNNEYSEEEFKSICDNYFVESFELNVWSSGLSKLLCTYFDDEIENDEINTYSIEEIRAWTYTYVYQDAVPKEDIKYCKDTYYSKVKTYY